MTPLRLTLDERGQSISVFVMLIMGALILTTGLVIDGGQKVAAASRAGTVAAAAGRAAGNAAATQRIAGNEPVGAAVRAARAYLAGEPGVEGSVTLQAGVVVVRTAVRQPTIVLTVIGIDTVTGHGSARASIVATGASR